MDHAKFKELIAKLYSVVDDLEKMFPGRPFTPDGHMVGSIGECLVADAYDIVLESPSNKGFDAQSKCGKKIEIKATQAKSVAFRSCPEHAIVIKINKDGTFEEFYNGPGNLIWEQFEGKPWPSNGQYQISLTKLQDIDASVPESDRVERIAQKPSTLR